MTQEEKAKRYDKALKAAIVAHKDEDKHLKATLERIFPELAKSEDEKMRKEIANYFKHYSGGDNISVKFPDWIAWLEKQDKKMSDPRYSILDKLIEADNIYQMAMNDAMVEEAKNKTIEALSKLAISTLLGLERQG